MNWLIVSGAAACGYLIGSISWSRIITRLVTHGREIQEFRYQVPRNDKVFTSDAASASIVRAQLGPKYGCLTSLLDMAKAAVSIYIFKLLAPDWPYFLVAGAASVVGHNWPVYYRFRGGRGASPIMGGVLVLDPLALIAALGGGSLLGIVIGHMLIFQWAWRILLIPLFWMRTRSWLYPGYILVCDIANVIAMVPEIRQFAGLKTRPTQEELSRFLRTGSKLGRWMDRYSLLGLICRISGKK